MKHEPRARSRTLSARSAAVLTACLGAIAILTTAYWVSEFHLPAPATANREDLMRWLVLRDLRTQTPEIRSTLLRRLQEEAQQDLDPDAIRTQLDPRYHDRLWTNILVLIESWYAHRVDGYLAAPASERPAYLDQTITEVEQWKDLAALAPGQDPSLPAPSAEAAILDLFVQQVTSWKEGASPQRRREITEFDAALRSRWLLHALGLAAG